MIGDGNNISSNAINTGSVQGKVGHFSGTSAGNSYGNSSRAPNFDGGKQTDESNAYLRRVISLNYTL